MVEQQKLVKELGVTARDLQVRRKRLLEGFHYYDAGRSYKWTDEGRDQVMFDMGLSPHPPSHVAEVAGKIPRNQRLVNTKITGLGYLVKVKDNKLYSKGFLFPVKWDGSGFYATRHPRYRGRL